MVDFDHNRDEDSLTPSVTSSASLSSFSDGVPEESATTVAVIGCGPGGMSFLHAVASRRKKLIEDNDIEGLRKIPLVTCFERNSLPGGVWMSSEEEPQLYSTNSMDSNESTNTTEGVNSETSTSTNMYEGLWINGCKEALEYFDYTFDDHFGCAMPAFLPRAQILDYMITRMTRHENIFNNVQFDTTVTSVDYDHSEKMFGIQTVDKHGVTSIQHFDKCIFSGGMNGSPKFANDIKSMLIKQNFHGLIAHSTEMNSLGPSVMGKRIVMVGDSYSAEDLALQCIKLGASKIYITSRKNTGSASYMGSWPDNKVEMIWYQLPYAVENGNTILCRTDEEDDSITTISDVSIVIFCTGYKPNVGMLSKELKPWEETSENVPLFPVPSDWEMNQNCLSDVLGTVEPPSKLKEESKFVTYKLYKRMLIENPNMMYLFEYSDYPLMEIDVAAWLCLAYVCGDVAIPSMKEMRKENRKEILQEMNGMYRYYLDTNYSSACANIPKDHWYHDTCSDGYKTYLREWGEYVVKRLARDQINAGYPIQFGTKDKLNKIGETLLDNYVIDSRSRYLLCEDDEDSKWKTFRDVEPSQFTSLFTGTKAVPLKGRWLDIDNNGNIIDC